MLISAKDHANVVAIAAAWGPGRRVPVIAGVRALPTESLARPERWTGHVVRRLLRLAYRRAAAVVCVGQGVADDIRRLAPQAPVSIIHNPVLTPEFWTDAAQPFDDPWFDTPGTTPVVAWCGRLTPEKDPATALSVFARVRRERPLRLLFVGDGPLRSELEDTARALGIAADVRFLGVMPTAAPVVARADVVLCTSRREGLPSLPIEALALGVRVVATDCGPGAREALDGGKYGRLVALDDEDALANALVEALDDHRRPHADPAFLEQFTTSASAAQYLALCRRLASA